MIGSCLCIARGTGKNRTASSLWPSVHGSKSGSCVPLSSDGTATLVLKVTPWPIGGFTAYDVSILAELLSQQIDGLSRSEAGSLRPEKCSKENPVHMLREAEVLIKDEGRSKNQFRDMWNEKYVSSALIKKVSRVLHSAASQWPDLPSWAGQGKTRRQVRWMGPAYAIGKSNRLAGWTGRCRPPDGSSRSFPLWECPLRSRLDSVSSTI